MATEVTFENRAALEPLFKPWAEPGSHRVPNEVKGGPAVVKPRRRPSRCPLVRAIRAEVGHFRQGGYAAASPTTRRLLKFWFESEHLVTNEDGDRAPFRYHWAQREAMETIAYLYEVRGMTSVAGLLSEYGDGKLDDIAAGIPYEEDRWAKYCAKVATGGGKTKVMSLAIVWSYFHRRFEAGSEMPQHFVVIAPNVTVYERLRDDFGDGKIFHRDPLIPEEWRQVFQMEVVLQDESGGTASAGALYLTNIHRLYESRDKAPDEGPTSIFGPAVKKAKALDTGESLRKRIAAHPALMVLNDEAHHLHDPDLAWNKAIDSLDRLSRGAGNKGVSLQLDFSATPKHNDGQLVRHVVCDFPLGEAVDAGIVKVPVLGESDELAAVPDPHMPFVDRYQPHLQLGYQLYERSLEEWGGVRKPILFVMTEDTASAKEVAKYLSDETLFPALGGKVLDVHTKVKGSLKEVTRNGRKVKEFVEGEKNLKPDELQFLRQLSRDLDSKDSPYRCVVSVLMLREGWDVKNVTTIVPLRAYSAKSGILPEQTLGRGLRRMAPNGDVPEKVVVVHHPAFRDLYDQELQQEGLDIAVLPIRDVFKETVTIFVDHEKKPVEDLEIELPLVSDSIETSAELSLTFDEVLARFQSVGWPRLPIKEKGNAEVSYVERQMFTDEIIAALRLEGGLLASATTAVSYFVQALSRRCHLPGGHAALAPLVQRFMSESLFERPVDLHSGEVDHRMRDADVKQYVLGVFANLVLGKTVTKKERKTLSQGVRLSTWKPYQASSTEKRPAVPANRTMFNLVPRENDFEQAFVDFCEHAPDVAAFAKNSGPQKLAIDYLKPDGNVGFYWPDFLIRTTTDRSYVVELKGKTDELVPLKAAAAREWCKSASRYADWRYLYVPYHVFQTSPSSSVEELERACLPALSALDREAATAQAPSPFDEVTAGQRTRDRVAEFVLAAGFDRAPESCAVQIRQAVETLDFAILRKHSNLASAFSVLLSPLDGFCRSMLVRRLAPHVPANMPPRLAYFDPDLSEFQPSARARLEKTQLHLRANLVEGRSMQLLGTLLFCLDYAQNWSEDAGGVWEDVRDEFARPEFGLLYEVVARINKLRNEKIAHEGDLPDREEAKAEMTHWIGGLCLFDQLLTDS
jgi:type III restriction enzyme